MSTVIFYEYIMVMMIVNESLSHNTPRLCAKHVTCVFHLFVTAVLQRI